MFLGITLVCASHPYTVHLRCRKRAKNEVEDAMKTPRKELRALLFSLVIFHSIERR
jgi:hypothetical protein